MTTYQAVCTQCGASFPAQRRTAQTCSPKCRQQRKRAGQVAAAQLFERLGQKAEVPTDRSLSAAIIAAWSINLVRQHFESLE